jgi:hypothetical protein
VARFAVGDAGPGEHEARDLVRRCTQCAALAADITAISRSVAKMPAPPRLRDFRLSPQQADHLRGSRFDRWLRSFTGSSWTTVRPVAAVALSVGMVMSVVGVLPALNSAAAPTLAPVNGPVAAGQSPESTADNRTGQGPAASPGNAQIQPPDSQSVETTASENIDHAYLNQKTAEPDQQQPLPQPVASGAGDANVLNKDVAGSGTGWPDALTLAGIAVTLLAALVLVLLYSARRRYYDPLLR